MVRLSEVEGEGNHDDVHVTLFDLTDFHEETSGEKALKVVRLVDELCDAE